MAFFAGALLILVALASYSASDPVWFFNTGAEGVPLNFAGRVGAFVAELSYQLLGYSAFLLPVVLVVVGWYYFWCKPIDAPYTKAAGAALLFACVSSFTALALGPTKTDGKEFRAGGYLGEWLAGSLTDYLNRTGAIILILTLLFLAIILSTQFSFGRLFAAVGEMARDRGAALAGAYRARREERRRDKQRQDVLKKHLDKAPTEAREKIAAAARRKEAAVKEPAAGEPVPGKPSRTAAM